ncbi:MAG: FAD-dependent oxidoreductase, partial [Dehalococcoidales bacterium]
LPDFRGAYTFSYIDPDWWGLLMFEMMTENRVNLLLHSLAVEVVKEGDTVRGVIVENTSGRQMVLGKIVIDCTGEGDICVRAGAPYEKIGKDQIQPHTISYTADGVDWDEFLKYMTENPEDFDWQRLINRTGWTKEHMIERIRQIKDITELGEVMGFFSLLDKGLKSGEWHGFSGLGFFLLPREGGVIQAHFQHSSQVGEVDPNNVRDLTYAEVECRRQVVIAWKFFRKYVPGFKHAYITRVCSEVRIRESGRVIGDYILTTEDVGEARQFKDTIGKSSFPAASHHTVGTGTLKKGAVYPKDKGSHDIPYRCLVPKNVENLLVAGKAVSTDRDAYLRYLMQTMVTGQAAGAAAALCVKKNITPRQLETDVSELQDILLKQGAILYGVQ